MLRIFEDELLNPKNFVVTLELVPGRESRGRNTDTLKGIARDGFADGRISAVSITDNPGGNPSLSPDVLGSEIFACGLDVIVHFTCRDLNRVGMESRALQLARMGMKNILALTGYYSGKGFGGQGKPVFDFDSVILTRVIRQWQAPESEFESEPGNGFYLDGPAKPPASFSRPIDRFKTTLREHLPYSVFKTVHNQSFEKKHPMVPYYRKAAEEMNTNPRAKWFKRLVEDPVKKPLLSCQSCGDCAIQHVAFLCPESGCPKYTRNGACGGSRDGFCEENPDRECVWVRAYKRLNRCNLAHTLAKDFVPPRMWELNNTSSWINFHLGKGHQKKK
jgi:methylenetetrahydrofolate reductase (NADPH)